MLHKPLACHCRMYSQYYLDIYIQSHQLLRHCQQRTAVYHWVSVGSSLAESLCSSVKQTITTLYFTFRGSGQWITCSQGLGWARLLPRRLKFGRKWKNFRKNERTYRKMRQDSGNFLNLPTREWEAGYGPGSGVNIKFNLICHIYLGWNTKMCIYILFWYGYIFISVITAV